MFSYELCSPTFYKQMYKKKMNCTQEELSGCWSCQPDENSGFFARLHAVPSNSWNLGKFPFLFLLYHLYISLFPSVLESPGLEGGRRKWQENTCDMKAKGISATDMGK